jgi:hypothetical protein
MVKAQNSVFRNMILLLRADVNKVPAPTPGLMFPPATRRDAACGNSAFNLILLLLFIYNKINTYMCKIKKNVYKYSFWS